MSKSQQQPNNNVSDLDEVILCELERDNPSLKPDATGRSFQHSFSSRTLMDAMNHLFNLQNLAIIMCTVVIGLVAYYIIFPSRGEFHSDCADTLMWAKAAYDGGTLLNPAFHYACLLPFGGQLIMIPLIALFGVSMTTHVIGMLIFFVLFVTSLFYLLRQMKWGITVSCLTVSMLLMLLSSSGKLREIFWGHIIYYSLGMFFLFVGLGLAFQTLNHAKDAGAKTKRLLSMLMLFVWCVLTATNQLESITLFSLPLICSWIAERFFSFENTCIKSKENRDTLLVVTVGLSGTVFGFLLGELLRGDIVAGYADAFSKFSNPEQWAENLSRFFPALCTLLGVTITEADPIASKSGVLDLIRMIIGVLLLIAPVIATVLYPKIKDRYARVMIWVHWVTTAIIAVGYIFGQLSAANWRLSPILGTSLLVTMVLCRWVYQCRPDYKRLIAIALVPFLLIGSLNMLQILRMPPDYKQDQGLYSIVNEMKDNDWTYGYATFWNANALTVISDSKVQCRSITLDKKSYRKYDYQQEDGWYDDQPGQKTYFVLLTQAEYDKMKIQKHPLLTAAYHIAPLKDYTVLLFDHNLF